MCLGPEAGTSLIQLGGHVLGGFVGPVVLAHGELLWAKQGPVLAFFLFLFVPSLFF